MPRFRFTIRRMTVAVAIVGLVFGAVELMRRRQFYSFKALLRRSLVERRMGTGYDRTDDNIRHWEREALRYERAALYPWLPVTPDPPAPERRG